MTLDLNTLNPGIRRLVGWLRARGFDTQDSGDGATHEHACDLPVPYVHIRVDDPHTLAAEAERLVSQLESKGIQTGPMNEEGTAKAVEASYNPSDGFGIVTLWNVTDADLDGDAQAPAL